MTANRLLKHLAVLERILTDGFRHGLPVPDVAASLGPGASVQLQWHKPTDLIEWAGHYGSPIASEITGGGARMVTSQWYWDNDETTTVRFTAYVPAAS